MAEQELDYTQPFEYFSIIENEDDLREYIKNYVDTATSENWDVDMIAEQVSKFAKYKELLEFIFDYKVLVVDDGYCEEPEIVERVVAESWD